MTTTAVDLDRAKPGPLALVRSELLKIRTTHTWWLFVLGALILLVVTILINWAQADFAFSDLSSEEVAPNEVATVDATRSPIYQAANLYTSGQFTGLMIVLLMGAVVVTNEFHHQTATTTFLTSPHRTAVILAKLLTATLFGAALWAISFLINIPATLGILALYDQSALLGESAVQRSIVLNLVAYMLWGILGVGLGVLIRSQLGATITGAVLYLIGTIAVFALVDVLSDVLGWEWVETAQYGFPSVASGLMVSGTNLPGQPEYWVGGIILIGWALVTGTIGTMILGRRDVS